jgi:hypothetical protein
LAGLMHAETDEKIYRGRAGFLPEPGGKPGRRKIGEAGQFRHCQSFIEVGQYMNQALFNLPVGIFRVAAIQL